VPGNYPARRTANEHNGLSSACARVSTAQTRGSYASVQTPVSICNQDEPRRPSLATDPGAGYGVEVTVLERPPLSGASWGPWTSARHRH